MVLKVRVFERKMTIIAIKGKKEWSMFTATLIDKQGDSVGISKALFRSPDERTTTSEALTAKYFPKSLWKFEAMKDVVAADPRYTAYTRPWVIRLTVGKVTVTPILASDAVDKEIPQMLLPNGEIRRAPSFNRRAAHFHVFLG